MIIGVSIVLINVNTQEAYSCVPDKLIKIQFGLWPTINSTVYCIYASNKTLHSTF